MKVDHPLKIGSDPPMQDLILEVRALAIRAIPDHHKRLDYLRELRRLQAECTEEEMRDYLADERAMLCEEAEKVEKQRKRENVLAFAKIAAPTVAAGLGLYFRS